MNTRLNFPLDELHQVIEAEDKFIAWCRSSRDCLVLNKCELALAAVRICDHFGVDPSDAGAWTNVARILQVRGRQPAIKRRQRARRRS
jgi:hypothetical protein